MMAVFLGGDVGRYRCVACSGRWWFQPDAVIGVWSTGMVRLNGRRVSRGFDGMAVWHD